MRVVPAYAPNGTTQTKWHMNGYQAAMIDLYEKMLSEGDEGMREWVKTNIRWDK